MSLQAASVVFAAGKGSRMIGYPGNKTLLPLIPSASPYEGEHPLLVEVLNNLPEGPKGIVVHHCAEQVKRALAGIVGVSFHFQPSTNGTGGALLAAGPFLQAVSENLVIITMGDVPLIRRATYEQICRETARHDLVVLAFAPRDRAQYGMLEMDGHRVLGIVEWKYWREYPPERRAALRFCNAGVYAARRDALLPYLERLASRPHTVRKQRGQEWVTLQEYFLTDLVEMMNEDGLNVGMVEAPESEVTGVDTPEALEQVQGEFARRYAESPSLSA